MSENKSVADYTIKELESEINALEWQVEFGSYGTNDLRLLNSLYNEVKHRELTVIKKIKLEKEVLKNDLP